MQIKKRQFNICTSQSTPALHFLDQQYSLYFENTEQLLKWGIQEVLFFAIELDSKNCKYTAMKTWFVLAHKILWLSNEELKLSIRH